jgi:hypothetical protein
VVVIVPVGEGGGVTVKPALGPDEGRISAVEWVPLAQDRRTAPGELLLRWVLTPPGSYSTRSPAIYSTNRSEVSDISI